MHLPLLQQISKIPHGLLRQSKILQHFENLDFEECVSFFDELHLNLKNPSYDYASIHLDFISHPQWRTFLGLKKLKKMYTYCLSQGNFLLGGVFYAKVTTSHEETTLPPDSARAALAKLTLGERKQLSRLSDRKKLDFLMYDSDPTVISALLNNPRILERDILKMIHQSFRSSKQLEKFYSHDKWLRVASVQKSLLCHEALPPNIFALLIRHAVKQDLQMIRERVQRDETKLLWIDYLLSV